MGEIIVRKPFVVIVGFIPHCLLSKIQMDFLKFSSAARLHTLDCIYIITHFPRVNFSNLCLIFYNMISLP